MEDKITLLCENCDDVIDEDQQNISIENSDTHEMLSVCGSCWRKLI